MTALDDRLAIYRPHIVREMREMLAQPWTTMWGRPDEEAQ